MLDPKADLGLVEWGASYPPFFEKQKIKTIENDCEFKMTEKANTLGGNPKASIVVSVQ